MWETATAALALLTGIASWTAKWITEAARQERALHEKLFDQKVTLYAEFLGSFVTAVIFQSTKGDEEGDLEHNPWREFMGRAYHVQLITRRPVREALDRLLDEVDRNAELLHDDPESFVSESVSSAMNRTIETMAADLLDPESIKVALPGFARRGPLGVVYRRIFAAMAKELEQRQVEIKTQWLRLWYRMETFRHLARDEEAEAASPDLPEAAAASLVPDEQRRSYFYWLNSGERYFQGSYKAMLEKGLACSYGPDSYRGHLEKLHPGDRLFLYVSGKGIVAMGEVVGASVTTRQKGEGITTAEDVEHSIETRWDLQFPAAAISASTIRKAGNNLFVRTFFWLKDEIGEQLERVARDRAGKPG